MPKKVAKVASKKKKTASRRVAKKTGSSASLLERFRKEAESMQKRLQASADKSVRQLEKQLLRQVHAATEDQVKRLEKRVASLEKTVKEYDERVRGMGVI